MSDSQKDVQLEQAKKEIHEKLKKYIERSPYRFNPDEEKVDEILAGLAMRKLKSGRHYCPCRVVTGDDKEDRKKVCPCFWHHQEIDKDGQCHCGIFVKKIVS